MYTYQYHLSSAASPSPIISYISGRAGRVLRREEGSNKFNTNSMYRNNSYSNDDNKLNTSPSR